MDCPVTQPCADPQFAEAVRAGLAASPKRLSSRYFYDQRGDEIFQRIMASPEYYLTGCELEILRDQGPAIAREISGGAPVELIELGSGDGLKIAWLLDAMNDVCPGFRYLPVDISGNSLDLLTEHLAPGRPWLKLQPVNANYLDWLDGLEASEFPRVFAFLGSNLGNFGRAGSIEFLRHVRQAMTIRDRLLIGLDLKKDPEVIRRAYDDSAGHTRDFNLNLLERINRELGGEFDVGAFEHRPEYDPLTGAARSYLVSTRSQEVFIAALESNFRFREGERIFMEVSQKYDRPLIDRLARDAGFDVAAAFHDARGWFTDQVWRPVPAASARG